MEGPTLEELGLKIKRLRAKQIVQTEEEIAAELLALKRAWNDRRDQELAEREAFLRSNHNGLSDAQVARLAGLVGRVTTLLHYRPGPAVDLETFLASLPDPTD